MKKLLHRDNSLGPTLLLDTADSYPPNVGVERSLEVERQIVDRHNDLYRPLLPKVKAAMGDVVARMTCASQKYRQAFESGI